MFETILLRLSTELKDLTDIVKWHDKLRETIFNPSTDNRQMPLSDEIVELMRGIAPQKLTWRLFDHCASITRIYAKFEQCIVELVEEYTKILPTIFPHYASLSQEIRTSHRVGVGYILAKWSETQPIYGKLPESFIAGGFVDGTRGAAYELLPDAFLTDSDNYRPDTLNRVFKKIGFNDAYAYVRCADKISDFCSTRLSNAHTADSYLNKFIADRNDAAHGNISNISGAEDIQNYADFSYLVASTLATLLRSHIIKNGTSSGLTEEVGEVIHCFSNNIVGVRATGTIKSLSNQKLYAGTKSFEPIEIISLRQGANELQDIDLLPGLEFGMKLDIKIPSGSKLYITKL